MLYRDSLYRYQGIRRRYGLFGYIPEFIIFAEQEDSLTTN